MRKRKGLRVKNKIILYRRASIERKDEGPIICHAPLLPYHAHPSPISMCIFDSFWYTNGVHVHDQSSSLSACLVVSHLCDLLLFTFCLHFHASLCRSLTLDSYLDINFNFGFYDSSSLISVSMVNNFGLQWGDGSPDFRSEFVGKADNWSLKLLKKRLWASRGILCIAVECKLAERSEAVDWTKKGLNFGQLTQSTSQGS